MLPPPKWGPWAEAGARHEVRPVGMRTKPTNRRKPAHQRDREWPLWSTGRRCLRRCDFAGRFLLVLVLATTAQADDWYGHLQGGGDIRVDAATNKATLYRGGVATPLWDGTHHLEDGSILIIRSGQAVPRTDIIEARRRLPQPEQIDWLGRTIVGYSPCEKLVRRVCGPANECGDAEPCSPAQQLRDMETQERTASANRNLMTYSSGQCQGALQDREYFKNCVPDQTEVPDHATGR